MTSFDYPDPDVEELPCGPCTSAAGEEIYHGPLGCPNRRGFPTEHGQKLESGRDPHVESFGEWIPITLDKDQLEEAARQLGGDPWVEGSIIDEESDRGATAVYNQMVHRETDGPDPLVPEP